MIDFPRVLVIVNTGAGAALCSMVSTMCAPSRAR
jgi:hypothetical protein